MFPLHTPWTHHVLDSVAEIHALIIGVTLGLALLYAHTEGVRATVAFSLGVLVGAIIVVWSRGVLVYWPASGHAWYVVGPVAGLVGVAGVLIR